MNSNAPKTNTSKSSILPKKGRKSGTISTGNTMYAIAAGNSILGASDTWRSRVSRQSSLTTPRNLISRKIALSKSHHGLLNLC